MPVSIVVGGQFGSEGKGKVALELVRRSKSPVVVVRVGGPNSGHTGYDRMGKKYALRQMPAAAVDRDADVVFPAGSYIDVDVLLSEIAELQYPLNRITISQFARVVTQAHKDWEREAGLTTAIGSTGSGVGAAVIASVARGARNLSLQSPDANHYGPLEGFVGDTSELLRRRIKDGWRVLVEGTQGFGLSLLEGGYWPKATSRATTAAGALAEAGLSPLDVDNITMVIRSFPIRVAGESGPLANETSWEQVAATSGSGDDLREYTTVTRKLRRVGYFDAEIVRRAIQVNAPTNIVLNHLDYIGPQDELRDPSSSVVAFIGNVERSIGQTVDAFGFSPLGIICGDGVFA